MANVLEQIQLEAIPAKKLIFLSSVIGTLCGKIDPSAKTIQLSVPAIRKTDAFWLEAKAVRAPLPVEAEVLSTSEWWKAKQNSDQTAAMAFAFGALSTVSPNLFISTTHYAGEQGFQLGRETPKELERTIEEIGNNINRLPLDDQTKERLTLEFHHSRGGHSR